MIIYPSIDKLLDQVDSKYSLVVLEAKRAHELRDKERPTKEFKAVKNTLRALEEIAAGDVIIDPKSKMLERDAEKLDHKD